MQAILLRFSLNPAPPPALASLTKKADRISAFFEATLYAGFEADEAKTLFGAPEIAPEPLEELLAPMSSDEAQKVFGGWSGSGSSSGGCDGTDHRLPASQAGAGGGGQRRGRRPLPAEPAPGAAAPEKRRARSGI